MKNIRRNFLCPTGKDEEFCQRIADVIIKTALVCAHNMAVFAARAGSQHADEHRMYLFSQPVTV